MKKYRLGVISDTHYPSRSTEFPVEKIADKFKGVDCIIHAGDIVSLELLEILNKISHVEAVCGNMDPAEVCSNLPKIKILEFGSVKAAITHGSGIPWNLPGRLLTSFKGSKIDILVFGHTHKPYNKIIEGILCFNPGSPLTGMFNEPGTVGLITISPEGRIDGEIVEI